MKQLSIYTENRRGALHRIHALLANGGVNVLSSITNESAECGIIRMTVADPPKAVEILEREGYLCCVHDVLAVAIPDEAGALAKLLEALDDMRVNIDYLYQTCDRLSGLPVMVLHTEGQQEVEESLESRGFAIRRDD